MLVLIAVAARTLDTGAARGLKKPLDTGCPSRRIPFLAGYLVAIVSSTLLPSARLL